MSPQVLVRCPPFPPCPPFFPRSPGSPPGDVYIHPRLPTPHPPSPSPPPRSPDHWPVPNQRSQIPGPMGPPIPAVDLVAPELPDPKPWWYGLLQGPQQAVSAVLLQRYLRLLEYMVDHM